MVRVWGYRVRAQGQIHVSDLRVGSGGVRV